MSRLASMKPARDGESGLSCEGRDEGHRVDMANAEQRQRVKPGAPRLARRAVLLVELQQAAPIGMPVSAKAEDISVEPLFIRRVIQMTGQIVSAVVSGGLRICPRNSIVAGERSDLRQNRFAVEHCVKLAQHGICGPVQAVAAITKPTPHSRIGPQTVLQFFSGLFAQLAHLLFGQFRRLTLTRHHPVIVALGFQRARDAVRSVGIERIDQARTVVDPEGCSVFLRGKSRGQHFSITVCEHSFSPLRLRSFSQAITSGQP